MGSPGGGQRRALSTVLRASTVSSPPTSLRQPGSPNARDLVRRDLRRAGSSPGDDVPRRAWADADGSCQVAWDAPAGDCAAGGRRTSRRWPLLLVCRALSASGWTCTSRRTRWCSRAPDRNGRYRPSISTTAGQQRRASPIRECCPCGLQLRHRGRDMSEHPLNCLDVRAGADGQWRRGVSRLVRCQARLTDRGRRGIEPRPACISVAERASSGAEKMSSFRLRPARLLVQKVLERNPGGGVGSGRRCSLQGERAPTRGPGKEKGTAIMKLTTMTQVSVGGVVQGNGGASDEDRRKDSSGSAGGPTSCSPATGA
jgi:hypothetical protein